MGPECPCCRIETFSGSRKLENQYNWSNKVCIRQQQFAICLVGGFTMTHPDLTLHNVLKTSTTHGLKVTVLLCHPLSFKYHLQDFCK